MTRVKLDRKNRLSQGDILRGINHVEYFNQDQNGIEISIVNYPYVVVLTQDCDLEQDAEIRHNPESNKIRLVSVLVAPLYNEDHFFAGSHLSNLNYESNPINKSKTHGKNIIQNSEPRYHYLTFDDSVPLPNSVIDFKHYFTIDITEYSAKLEKHFVCSLKELFREQLSHRFSYYLSRIGLPND